MPASQLCAVSSVIWSRWARSRKIPAKRSSGKVPEKLPPVLEDTEIKKLLRVTSGTDFTSRRDHAILRLMIDCGIRRDEVAALRVSDINLDAQIIIIARRKGGNSGSVPIGVKTCVAIDRYLLARSRRRNANLEVLWLGPRGPLTGDGLLQIVKSRARESGLGLVRG